MLISAFTLKTYDFVSATKPLPGFSFAASSVFVNLPEEQEFFSVYLHIVFGCSDVPRDVSTERYPNGPCNYFPHVFHF
jgi:hypothetical protein